MAKKDKRRAHIEEEEELLELPEIEAEVEERYLPVAEEPTEVEPIEEERRYFIDPQWYEERGLVFNNVAQGRFCPTCISRLGTFETERVPVVDPKTKRVSFEVRNVPYGSNPMKTIREDCSRHRDYITAETPLLEAIFRVFLANGNQPMPLSTVREHLLTYLPEMAALGRTSPRSC
jgi:hypothetical protein